jgi:hypothetical protein
MSSADTEEKIKNFLSQYFAGWGGISFSGICEKIESLHDYEL